MNVKDWIILLLIVFIIVAWIRGTIINRREAKARALKSKREANQALLFMVSMIGVEALTRFIRHKKKQKAIEEEERNLEGDQN